jgi:hypothetical protein
LAPKSCWKRLKMEDRGMGGMVQPLRISDCSETQIAL